LGGWSGARKIGSEEKVGGTDGRKEERKEERARLGKETWVGVGGQGGGEGGRERMREAVVNGWGVRDMQLLQRDPV
jgi:hypothetical protein